MRGRGAAITTQRLTFFRNVWAFAKPGNVHQGAWLDDKAGFG
jgi:hypothetical protein